MPAQFSQSSPFLKKDSRGNVKEIHHNHSRTLDYAVEEKDQQKLNKRIVQEKIALKGCMTFFKALAEDPKSSGIVRATALGALKEDEARLKDFASHKASSCVIM